MLKPWEKDKIEVFLQSSGVMMKKKQLLFFKKLLKAAEGNRTPITSLGSSDNNHYMTAAKSIMKYI